MARLYYLPASVDSASSASPPSSLEPGPWRCMCSSSPSSFIALSALKFNVISASELPSALPAAGSSNNFYSSSKYCSGHRKRWSTWRHGQLGKFRTPGSFRVSANSKADDSLPTEMSLENALQILGVAEGASFEEILRAKNAILGKHSGDQEVAVQVEAAYDVLLMQSLLQRRAGKVVDNSVRYADVKKIKNISGMAGPQWFRDALSKSPVALEAPPAATVGVQSAVYAGLMVWTFASGVSSQPSANVNADAPGLILAIGFGASLYFLRRQNVKLGKAAALTIAGLVGGAFLGGAVESWLRVDLIPVFGIGSPAVVITEFVLVSLWLSSLYLR